MGLAPSIYPLPFKGELKRGFAPFNPFPRRGGGIKERGIRPLLKLLPPSPLGEGGQGDGVNAEEKRHVIICVTNLSELAHRGKRRAPRSAGGSEVSGRGVTPLVQTGF